MYMYDVLVGALVTSHTIDRNTGVKCAIRMFAYSSFKLSHNPLS